MGPRSHDRGIAGRDPRLHADEVLQWGRGRTTAESRRGWLAIHATTSLQWGRGRTTAESGLGLRHGVLVRLASMGPRSHDRGIPGCQCDGHDHDRASMGPRSHDRGIGNQELAGGAATDGFNGAAVARPRNRRLHDANPASEPALQWGRGRTTAESMSVALTVAGYSSLQWGRGRTTAESWLEMALERGDIGFNGAAVARPRNRPHHGRGWHDHLASMGPRSHDRGIATAPSHAPAMMRLQWGRGRTTAESARSATTTSAWTGFNGAAVARPRNRRGDRSRLPVGRASMGPRSHDRGIMPGRRNCAPRCRFNGAAVARPRNRARVEVGDAPVYELQWGRGRMTAESGDQRDRAGELSDASMGPRSHDRGICAGRGSAAASSAGFNGAAVA